jgi:hypothetical protein
MRRIFLNVAGGVAILLAPALAGPDDHPRGYVCVRASSPLTVDGRLDEGAWRDAAWTDDFVDIEGDRKPRPTLRTRVKMLWDDMYFYIGADLAEPHLWGTMKEHDSVLFHENDFEFFIDPNGDNHEYYEFEINALGTGWDLLLPRPYKDEGKAVNNWEIRGLKSAVHLDGTLNDPRDVDRGWSIELAVPWTALGELARRPSPPRDGDQWRVNFSRVQWTIEASERRYKKVEGTKEHNWVWSPQHVIDMHRPESWGYVQFERAPRPFVPDVTWPARRWLHQVYYAQRDYRKANGRWAGSLEELRVPGPPAGLARPVLERAGDLFDVSIDLQGSDGKSHRWHIRQDSLIRTDRVGGGG